MPRALRPLVLACAAASLGCGGATEPASDGRIRIEVTTSGADPQTEEYLVTLDGARPLAVAPNGSTIYDAVSEGTHVVHLFALADNCVVSGSTSPRSVSVRGGSGRRDQVHRPLRSARSPAVFASWCPAPARKPTVTGTSSPSPERRSAGSA